MRRLRSHQQQHQPPPPPGHISSKQVLDSHRRIPFHSNAEEKPEGCADGCGRSPARRPCALAKGMPTTGEMLLPPHPMGAGRYWCSSFCIARVNKVKAELSTRTSQKFWRWCVDSVGSAVSLTVPPDFDLLVSTALISADRVGKFSAVSRTVPPGGSPPNLFFFFRQH